MRLMITGTGTPMPQLNSAGPGQLVEINGERWQVDCGDRTTSQLMGAGVNPAEVVNLLFTHLHSDHTHGLSQFVMGGWYLGRRALSVRGPEGTKRFLKALFDDAFGFDIRQRYTFGMPREGIENMEVSEFGAGTVLERPGYRITACLTPHHVENYALRFETGGQDLVLSGDTGYSADVAKFSEGAHTLVHEATRVANTLRPGHTPHPDAPKYHSTPEQAAQVAKEAGVKRLVLTHFRSAPTSADNLYERCKAIFSGEVVVGHDLLALEV